MARVDRDKVIRLAQQSYVSFIEVQCGENGIQRLLILLQVLKRIYGVVEPSICKGKITVFISLKLPIRRINNVKGKRLLDEAELLSLVDKPIVIEVLENGDAYYWTDIPTVPDNLKQSAIVYHHDAGVEYITANDQSMIIDNPLIGYSSMFAVPTFTDLLEALENYNLHAAKYSRCPTLNSIWSDDNRIMLRAKPESLMRTSLAFFLSITVLGADVREEQPMDPDNPVDIKVTWALSRKIAVIEIKWLGKSITANGNIVSYSDSRANDGAKQLKDYLDMNQTYAPDYLSRGYLVVFDARRKAVKLNQAEISRTHGYHFENIDVKYNPKYEDLRLDFEKPVRFFLAPKCQ